MARAKIKVGTGVSRAEKAYDAGRAAAMAAVQPLGGQPPALVMVFTTPRYDLPVLVEEVVGTSLGARRDAGVLLTFSCAARARIYGERAAEEPRRLQAAAGDVPTFGFYCCGEFARTAGPLGTHNATLTAVAL